MRQTIPRMRQATVSATEIDAIMEKNVQVMNVQRKVTEMNMTPHPPR
jgi:hypothetical protein